MRNLHQVTNTVEQYGTLRRYYFFSSLRFVTPPGRIQCTRDSPQHLLNRSLTSRWPAAASVAKGRAVIFVASAFGSLLLPLAFSFLAFPYLCFLSFALALLVLPLALLLLGSSCFCGVVGGQ